MNSVRADACASSTGRYGPNPTTTSLASTCRIAASSNCTPFCSISFPKYTTVDSSPERNAREALRVALVGQALVAAARVGRVGLGLGEQIGESGFAILQRELLDVDARRHGVHPVDVTDDLLEHAADVLRADECRLCGGQRLAPPALELRTSSHRILELGAVRLDAERRTGRLADRSSEQHVVDEDEVGREPAQHLCVRCDVCGALAGRQVLQESWL